MFRRLGIALFGCCFCAAGALRAETAVQPLTSAGSYFAPYGGAGLYRMRLSDGSIREFELIPGSTNRISGAGGWTGLIRGDETDIRSPGPVASSTLYRFRSGRLVASAHGTATPKQTAAGTWPELPLAALWPPPVDEKTVMDEFDPWRNAAFLKLGFVNPNRCGAFLALAALVLAGFAVSARRRWVKTVLGLCAAAVFVAVFFTHSRGAVVAFSIGLSCYFLPRLFKMPRRYLVVFVTSVVLLLAVGIFACYGKSGTGRAWSSSQRIDIWRYTPRMMVDAPDGWGFVSSGRAYVDWYQPLDQHFTARTLINDHLTILVSCGWPLRFGYVFLWLLALGGALKAAREGATAMPLAVWSAFAAAAWFNPLMESPALWIAPAVGGVVFAVHARPWRRCARYGRVFMAAALCALVVSGGLYVAGSFMPEPMPRVRAQNGIVRVNGIRPESLLVCDDVVLGNGLTEKQLRAFYAANPKAPSLSYLYDIAALPSALPRRLVLAGRTGAEFLDRWVSAPDGAKPSLPRELLFISPTFPPWAVPEAILKSCRVRIVIGEFLARFDPGYAAPLPWVDVVPGDELCVHDWVARAVIPDFAGRQATPQLASPPQIGPQSYSNESR